jgi:uridine kinase
MNPVHELTEKITERYKQHSSSAAFTVAISGIDASGKGCITKLLQEELENRGYKAANINIDPWQNPIPVRLKKENAAENVYENIFRWNDFFEQLLFPLKKNKSIYLEMQGIQSDADIYYPLIYDYKDIDILLIEGILLFKKKHLCYYDYKIWIECTFETGLKRAIKRNVEKLDEERLIQDYHTFYYPAQRLHFERDCPVAAADIIYDNNLTTSTENFSNH